MRILFSTPATLNCSIFIVIGENIFCAKKTFDNFIALTWGCDPINEFGTNIQYTRGSYRFSRFLHFILQTSQFRQSSSFIFHNLSATYRCNFYLYGRIKLVICILFRSQYFPQCTPFNDFICNILDARLEKSISTAVSFFLALNVSCQFFALNNGFNNKSTNIDFYFRLTVFCFFVFLCFRFH